MDGTYHPSQANQGGSRRGTLVVLGLLSWLDESQKLLEPPQGDSLPENKVNLEEGRAKRWQMDRKVEMGDPRSSHA